MTSTIMPKHEFVRQVELYKPIMWGRGRQIAEIAGVDYPTYQSYFKGIASNQDIMERILMACRRIKDDIARQIEVIDKEI